MPLPDGFRFGVATSGFQIEGGYNGPGQPANNWRDWERSGRAAEPAGAALDFWNRYEDVLDRAVAAGCQAFRLSVEWARCEPSPGHYDEEAFARYRAILDACHARDMEPVVTLHHFTHPAWLGPDLWLDLRSPDRFAAWAAAAAERLGDRCRNWFTINEVNAVAFQTYFTAALPPGRLGRTGDVVRALAHLLAGHVLAYRAIHRRQPDAVVSTNNHALSVYELDPLLIDLLLGRSHGVERADLRDWLAERRHRYHGGLPAPSRLERAQRTVAASILRFDQPFARAVTELYQGPDERPIDVILLNYYDPVTANRVWLPGRRTVGGRNWSPFRQLTDSAVNPEGLTRYCRLNHEPGLEMWLAENGLCNRVRSSVTYGRRDGWDRARYLRANLAAVEAAVQEGLPVTRYFHWTLADSYEWGTYEHRFGLYRVDQMDGAPVWSDVDAFGGDAAGAYRRLAESLRRAQPLPVAP
ncbi:MAG: family 1 glycosylhydrolase [Acidimicrobiales bacterium]